MAPPARHQPPHTFDQPARPVDVELQLGHERVGPALFHVFEDAPAQVWRRQPEDAAGLQHAQALGQEAGGFPAVEMLDHVRGIDDIDGGTCVRDAPGGIGMADTEAPAIGNERNVARVD